MDLLLSDLKWSVCCIYIDDVVIFAKDVEEHAADLVEVFSRLRKANVKVKPSKCHFAKPEVELLGHIVNAEGVKVDPKKVAVLHDWPRPRNVRQLRGFIGFASYYRRFIKGFSNTAAPLTSLLKARTPWAWGDAQQAAFEALKEALTSAPVLRYPDFTRPFILQTDASVDGFGAVLKQKDIRGLEYLVIANRHAKWAERLMRFMPFDIEYVKGTKNIEPDVLSRLYEKYTKVDKATETDPDPFFGARTNAACGARTNEPAAAAVVSSVAASAPAAGHVDVGYTQAAVDCDLQLAGEALVALLASKGDRLAISEFLRKREVAHRLKGKTEAPRVASQFRPWPGSPRLRLAGSCDEFAP
eukprot:tig00021247_g19660.t1